MDLYIDTANLQEIKEAISWGVIDGVTTNPSLIKKEVERLKSAGQTVNIQQHIGAICQAAGAEHPVSLEVTATDAQGMLEQGKKLFQMFNGVAENVVIKIPINPNIGRGNAFDGLKAIKALEEAEIPVNATLVFTPEQALLAAKAGATYVSPFTGRVDDMLRDSVQMEYGKTDYFPAEGEETGEDEEDIEDNGIVSGVDLVAKICDLFEKHEIDCNVLAASIRNPRQVRDVAMVGADIATVPFGILKRLVEHMKTTEGMQKFTADIVPEYASLLGGSAPTPLSGQTSSPEAGRPTHQMPSQQPSQSQVPPQRPQPSPAPEQPVRRPGQMPNSAPSAYDLANRQQ